MSEKYAFPGYLHTRLENGEMHAQSFPGMTLRQWYAGLAMQGFCATEWSFGRDARHIVRVSVELADALINELNGETS